MQTIASPSTTATQPAGIVVNSAISAGPRLSMNHCEGIVVSTAITGGALTANHAEGIVVS